MSLFKLFLIFVKIGAILLGGGYVILPIMTSEFVDKRNLVSHDDLINYFALAQSLPGIIAANISMFIGYKLKGKWGAVAAMAGVTFVPFWCIVLLASVLGALTNNSYVQGALWGVGISVIALIVLTFILFLSSLLRPCLYLSCRQYKPLCCSLCSGFYIKDSGRQKNDIYTFVS